MASKLNWLCLLTYYQASVGFDIPREDNPNEVEPKISPIPIKVTNQVSADSDIPSEED